MTIGCSLLNTLKTKSKLKKEDMRDWVRQRPDENIMDWAFRIHKTKRPSKTHICRCAKEDQDSGRLDELRRYHGWGGCDGDSTVYASAPNCCWGRPRNQVHISWRDSPNSWDATGYVCPSEGLVNRAKEIVAAITEILFEITENAPSLLPTLLPIFPDRVIDDDLRVYSPAFGYLSELQLFKYRVLDEEIKLYGVSGKPVTELMKDYLIYKLFRKPMTIYHPKEEMT